MTGRGNARRPILEPAGIELHNLLLLISERRAVLLLLMMMILVPAVQVVHVALWPLSWVKWRQLVLIWGVLRMQCEYP